MKSSFILVMLCCVLGYGQAIAEQKAADVLPASIKKDALYLVEKGEALLADGLALRAQADALRAQMESIANHPLNNQSLRGVNRSEDVDTTADAPKEWELEVAELLAEADAAEAAAEDVWRDAVAIDANAQQMILQRMLELSKGK